MKIGTQGKLHLCFTRSDSGQTKLQVKTQRPPLRVIRAFAHQDDVALVHLHNVSGGVLGGDLLDIQIDLEPQAHGMVTTTGANRIYRHREGYVTATQTMSVNLAADSIFEYIPDSTIPFAQSRYQQNSYICLEHGAKLFWSELLGPGREAFEERFSWDSVGYDLQIMSNDRPILLEKWQLNPHERPLDSLARMGPWTHSATFIACHCQASSSELFGLERELTAVAQENSTDDTIWGVSRLVQDGVIVRGMSTVGWGLSDQITQFHNCARQYLLGKALIKPRKIY